MLFFLADPILKISDQIQDPKLYCNLTDCILKTIETSTAQELQPAREIIKRIRTRKLYKFADEFIIPPEKWTHFPKNKITESEILTHQDASQIKLTERDVIADVCVNNYAMKDKNPVDNVKFFSKWEQNTSFRIPVESVSLLIPSQFSERYIRIYCRDADKVPAAQKAFRNFLKHMGCPPSPQHAFPNGKNFSISPVKIPFEELDKQ